MEIEPFFLYYCSAINEKERMILAKKIAPLIALVCCIGCSSTREREWTSISLTRYGGFSGLEETTELQSSGIARKHMHFPNKPDTTVKQLTIEKALFDSVANYVDRSFPALEHTTLQGSGNMTTRLDIAGKEHSISLSWPNIDPPASAPTEVDTVYHLMMRVQQTLATE